MGGCGECKKRASLAPCSVHKAPETPVCKDCCIGRLKGHGCPWWVICWGD